MTRQAKEQRIDFSPSFRSPFFGLTGTRRCKAPPSEGVTPGEYVISAMAAPGRQVPWSQADAALGKALSAAEMRWKSATPADRIALRLLSSAPFPELPPKA